MTERNNMKKIVFAVLALLIANAAIAAGEKVAFDEFFTNATLRIDYLHTGSAKSEKFAIDAIYKRGAWAGSTTKLIDDRNLGRYTVKIFDHKSGKLIFSRGFDAYFGEYKSTDDGIKGIEKTYHESALIPFPKNKIVFVVDGRDKKNRPYQAFRKIIDPSKDGTLSEALKPSDVQVIQVSGKSDPHKSLDITVVAEGYTKSERAKVEKDLKRFATTILKVAPFSKFKDKINIRGVFKPSNESGCDEPSHGITKNTSIDATFDSLGSERYLMTENNKALRDIAGEAPYDALVIMVNHKRYGGGGIFGLYSVFTTDNQWYEYLITHEFGHSFAGLADEYYSSSTAYNDFYPRGIEPLEPNITALLKNEPLKWANLATKGIEIPTPWEKADYDKMDGEYQKRRQELNKKLAEMKVGKAPAKEIAKLEAEIEIFSKDSAVKSDNFLAKSKFVGAVGAFEGAGYSSQGLYRPMLDCIMFTKGMKPFCKVCQEAIKRSIERFL